MTMEYRVPLEVDEDGWMNRAHLQRSVAGMVESQNVRKWYVPPVSRAFS